MKYTTGDQVSYKGNLYHYVYEFGGVTYIKRGGQVTKAKSSEVSKVDTERKFKV